MQVAAQCIMPAFDSSNCVPYKPGQGPLPGGLYEIDRNGPLASLKTNGGKTGKYVFEFDRNAGPDDKPHDYSCKKCEQKFKTLNALGTHMNAEHKDQSVDDEPVVVAKDMRGKTRKNNGFKCKDCGEVCPNLYALKVHKQTHKAAVEEAA